MDTPDKAKNITGWAPGRAQNRGACSLSPFLSYLYQPSPPSVVFFHVFILTHLRSHAFLPIDASIKQLKKPHPYHITLHNQFRMHTNDIINQLSFEWLTFSIYCSSLFATRFAIQLILLIVLMKHSDGMTLYGSHESITLNVVLTTCDAIKSPIVD